MLPRTFPKNAGMCWSRWVRYTASTPKRKERGLTPEERLTFHQSNSAPVMDDLHRWLTNQFAEHKTEPNSGLGKAISYLLRHWPELTLFLRQAGAPLDNNGTTAASGSGAVMPRAGLCRVTGARCLLFGRISNISCAKHRHNHRLSRKESNESAGRKRSGTRPVEVVQARARCLW